MKNILILGGHSKNNILWVKEMEKLFSNDYNVNIIKYDHWNSNEEINFETELSKISNIKDIDIVLAKSIGILVTIKAIKQNIIKPEKIIFMGYPLEALKADNIDVKDDIIDVNNNNITLIQQTNDPQGSFEEIKKIFNDKISVVEINGNNHFYDDYQNLKVTIYNIIK